VTYTKKTTVEAERFDPDNLPWPSGVTANENSPTGYALQSEVGPQWFPVSPGDYIVSDQRGVKVVGAADFEYEYEV
jgi:regulator of RNase E activity RraA